MIELGTVANIFLILTICNILLPIQQIDATLKLQTQFEWSAMDYAYPTYQAKMYALQTKRFIPENNLPVGIEIWHDKLFVTVPRWRAGIPSTLNYVHLDGRQPKSPVLIPYPDWDSNELGNCHNGLSTVYRIKADACNRLWVLDTGTFGIGNTTQNPCPYALNVFDLTTNRRLRRYELRAADTNANTFIANIVVDVGQNCDDTYAYLSDELGYGLIVYSWLEDRSWRFMHSYFMPDPLAGNFFIGQLNFQWGEEGIFGMALSPVQPDGGKLLYFSPLASYREFAVATSTLKNSSKVDDSYYNFVVLGSRGESTHTTARVMDENGIEFFNLIDRNAVGCWNSALPYKVDNLDVLDRDDKELEFTSDVKIDADRNVWVMSDRMSTFLLANLDFNQINFRVFFAPIDVLVANTTCEIRFDPVAIPNYANNYHFNHINPYKFG